MTTFDDAFKNHFDRYSIAVDPATSYARNYLYTRHILEKIGHIDISSIDLEDILPIFHKLEDEKKTKTLWNVYQIISQIFDYAIVILRVCKTNHVQPLKRFLMKHKQINHPFLLENQMTDLFVQVKEKGQLSLQAKVVFLLIAYTAVRSNEARGAKWDEIDFQNGLWEIPSNRMKMRREHLVPLSSQVIELLLWWKEHAPKSEYLFPARNKRNKQHYMIGQSLSQSICRTEYNQRHRIHSFRHRFSTTAYESNKWRDGAIEYCLAHKMTGVKGVYNKAKYLAERKRIMQWYADNYVSQWSRDFIIERKC